MADEPTRLRIIIDIDDVADAKKCLDLALEQQRLDGGGDFGYWNASDPSFSAYIRSTKTGVSVHGRRKPKEMLRDRTNTIPPQD